MERLFSNFPDRLPGFGLILIRLAVSLDVVVKGISTLAAPNPPELSLWVIGLVEILAGVALLLGFLTPIVTTLIAFGNLISGASLILSTDANEHAAAFTVFTLALISIGLVLLGPGAFSVDARLFGPREIIIPEARRPPWQ